MKNAFYLFLLSATSLAGQTTCTTFGMQAPIAGGPNGGRLIPIILNNDRVTDAAWVSPSGGFEYAVAIPGSTIQFGPITRLGQGAIIDIATGDFNLDGYPDIALLKSTGIEIWNNTQATPLFALSQTIPVTQPVAFKVADMNGDARADIGVVAGSQFLPFRSTTLGFVADAPFNAPTQLADLVLGDRTGDGLPDLGTIGTARNVNLCQNSSVSPGAIQFSCGAFLTNGAFPTSGLFARQADLTRDGFSDAVLGSNTSNSLFILPASFGAIAASTPPISLPLPLIDFDIADVNGDGVLDLITLDSSGASVLINTTPAYTGTGTSAFYSFASPVSLGGAGAQSVTAGRFRSGVMDLLLTGAPGAQMTPLLNGYFSMVLSSSPNPAVSGSLIQFQATAVGANCGVPAGQVDFVRGATKLGTAGVDRRGVATLNTTLSPGIQPVTASYVRASSSDPYTSARATLTQFVDASTCANIVSQVQVQKGGLLYARATNQWLQTVTVRNTGTTPITGPVSLALNGLTAGVTVSGASPATGCAVPQGTPVIDLNVCSGGSIAPGGTVSTTLRFSGATASTASYTPAVLSGLMPR